MYLSILICHQLTKFNVSFHLSSADFSLIVSKHISMDSLVQFKSSWSPPAHPIFLSDLLFAIDEVFLSVVVNTSPALHKIISKTLPKIFPNTESWRHPLNKVKTILSNCYTWFRQFLTY